jgi:type VI secretion system protein ImpC
MEFNFSLSRRAVPRISNRGPMRLLVLGDFSALPANERPALATRTTHRVDLDNLDETLRRLAPRTALDGGEVAFAALDDFHPDRLFARLPVFRALRTLRQRLLDPAQCAQAAAELMQVSVVPVAASALPAAPNEGLLAQLLGGKPAAAQVAAAPASGIDALIRSIVAPHIVPDIAPQQATALAAVDAAIAEQMRALLHAPAFQALEANWRGVQWLISSLELDDGLQLHLFDISREELLADVVAAQGRIEATGVYQALVERWRNQPGGDAWTALVGLYGFGPSDTDIGLLAALGVVASQAGGPVLAGADPALAGANPAALAGWAALRASEVAPWIGLAAPRVLLRLPYGKGSDPIEGFSFEEFGATPVHAEFLWGNGALACALLIGQSFTQRGWDFTPGDLREIGDLPAYMVLQAGEKELQACAEQYLGETAGQLLLQAGLMPLMSHRHRNALTVLRFQSVAEPAQALAGLDGAG